MCVFLLVGCLESKLNYYDKITGIIINIVLKLTTVKNERGIRRIVMITVRRYTLKRILSLKNDLGVKRVEKFNVFRVVVLEEN